MINEILQWIVLAIVFFVAVVPKIAQVVRDFRSEEEDARDR